MLLVAHVRALCFYDSVFWYYIVWTKITATMICWHAQMVSASHDLLEGCSILDEGDKAECRHLDHDPVELVGVDDQLCELCDVSQHIFMTENDTS